MIVMEKKPEIQYVGQFYVYGSEARKLAIHRPARKAEKELPEALPEQQKIIRVDPMAVIGILLAVVMLVVLVNGALQIRSALDEYEVMNEYLTQLKRENAQLEQTYRSGYDLDEVEMTALALGMVPATEVQSISIHVTIPQPEEEPGFWEDFTWFLKGLFA